MVVSLLSKLLYTCKGINTRNPDPAHGGLLSPTRGLNDVSRGAPHGSASCRDVRPIATVGISGDAGQKEGFRRLARPPSPLKNAPPWARACAPPPWRLPTGVLTF